MDAPPRPPGAERKRRQECDDELEKAIQNEILEALGPRRDLRIWRINTGVARSMDFKRVIRFGVPGQADISGVLIDGRRLEIEVKTPTGRQSPQQKAFEAMIKSFGGVYILARSLADAVAGVERALYRR
jgi:hypothetical protein